MAGRTALPTGTPHDRVREPLALYSLMVTSREADRREAICVRQGLGRFTVSGAGHEALAAVATCLGDDDYLFPHYRDRALMLARGVTLDELALDFLARAGSSSEGRNMPAHFSCRRRNVFSIASPVGSSCLPAAGTAWRCRLAARGDVAVCCLGDGGTRQGEFFEAVALALTDRLPLVFVIEANGLAISTRTEGLTPLDLDLLPGHACDDLDGSDPDAVLEAAGRAVAKAREGYGPTVLWCRCERLESHTSADDQTQYRSEDELAIAAERDPIAVYSGRLAAMGLAPEALADIRDEAAQRVADAYARAVEAPQPAADLAVRGVLGPVRRLEPPSAAASAPAMLADGVNQVLAAALEALPEVLVYGEDIEDPRGGVFGLTRGLSTRFPGRVLNSPLAEATIVGAAVGLAAAGLRPVVELQFIDFVGPALNQLLSQATTLRWRSAGSWTCPLLIYAPCGGYVSGGIWHSQTNEAWWAHTPGLRVAMPGCAADAIGLFWSALGADDPTLILLPKLRLRLRQAPEPLVPVPFGRARVRRNGTDVTVVSWGNGVGLAEAAAESLAGEGIAAEVLDLRSLVPCDWAAILDSVGRTGRLVVVEEDSRTCGFGSYLIAEMTGREDRLALHLAAPRRIGRGDVLVPFAESLEQAVQPQAEDIARAVREMLE